MRESESLLTKLTNVHSWLAILLAEVIVALWTVFRFISNGANFDVVGQIGLSLQWLKGMASGAELGATSYLLKMPVYALINLASFISPHLRLLILALIFNLSTFVIIYWLGRKILKLYGVKNHSLLDLGLVWMAVIAGRNFWLDYANSRNLEIAGGVIAFYLSLRFLETKKLSHAFWLLALSTIVFFADPLQIFTVGAGLIIYCGLVAFRARRTRQKATAIVCMGLIILAAGLSKALLVVASKILPVKFLVPPSQSFDWSVSTITASVNGALKGTLRMFDLDIFAKSFGIVSLRHLVAIVLFALASYALWSLVRAGKSSLIWPFVMVIASSYAVYIASGNALKPGTERYLISVPIFTTLIIGLAGDTKNWRQTQVQITLLWFSSAVVSMLLLTGAIYQSWPNRFSADQPMFALADYARKHDYKAVISGRAQALPADYYTNYSKKIIPTICGPDHLVTATNLFYDRSQYTSLINQRGTIAVVVPNGGILSEQFVCSYQDVENQFGTPSTIEEAPGIGKSLIYKAPLQNLPMQ